MKASLQKGTQNEKNRKTQPEGDIQRSTSDTLGFQEEYRLSIFAVQGDTIIVGDE